MLLTLTNDPHLLSQAGEPRSVTVFGVEIGSHPTDVSHLPIEHLATLKSNPFFIEAKRGTAPVPVPPKAPKAAEAERRLAVIAELTAMSVVFKKSAKLEVLEALLAEAKGPPVPVPADEDPIRAELIAQLEGLGVRFDPDADTEALEAALDAATAPGED